MNDSDRVAAEVEFELNVNKAMEEIKGIAKRFGLAWDEVAKQMSFKGTRPWEELEEALNRLEKEAKDAADAVGDINDEAEGVADAKPKVESFSQSLTGLAKVALQVVAALLGFRVLQEIKQFFTESIEAAEEFSVSLYRLEVSIRALQRTGLDITFESAWKNIQKMRDEYGVFATKDLVAGYSQMYNLTRELGLHEDSIQRLIDMSATLSLVAGKNIEETQRMIAMALSSGYTEGLQRLGIAISRFSIAKKAQEMGFGSNYMSLSENERALATIAILEEQIVKYEQDALAYRETSAGKLEEQRAKLSDISTVLGTKLLPIWITIVQLFTNFVGLLLRLQPILLPIITGFQQMGIYAQAWRDILADIKRISEEGGGLKAYFASVRDRIKEAREEAFGLYKAIFERQTPKPEQLLGDTEVAEAANVEEQIAESLDTVMGDIEGIWEDHNEKMAKLARDLQSDLEKIERDGANRREELARRLAYRLESLERNYNQKIAKAGRDYQNSLAKIHDDQQRKIAEITQKYRDKELDAEAKHIEALRKLRERLIFDVEEAARVRDASAARKALREYQLNRSQTVRDFEIDKEARARDYQRDIEAARQAEQQKREEAWIAYQQRLEDTRLQYEFDRKEAQIKYKQDLDELRISMANQRKERMISYREQQRDLIRAYEERLKAVASALVAEYGMIQDAGTAITKLLASIYGPNSTIDQIMKYYYDLLGGAGAIETSPFSGVTSGVTARGLASGGTFIASKPTLLAVGEGGMPEKVTVEPIGYRGATENMIFGNSGMGLANNLFEKAGVEIFLSPGLESRIIKKSNDVMTNELVKVFRRRG